MSDGPIVIEIDGVRYTVDPSERPTGATGWFAELDVEHRGARTRLSVSVEAAAQQRPAPEPRPGSVLGVPDDVALAHMASAPIVRTKIMKGGSTLSLRLHLEGGQMVLAKPAQVSPHTSPRKEVAAYLLARLTGLAAVPPTALRRIHRDEIIGTIPADATFFTPRILAETQFDADGTADASLAVWIPDLTDTRLDTLPSIRTWGRWLGVHGEVPAEHTSLMRQLSSLLLFDALISNEDRFTGGALLSSADGTVLYAIDHSLGFDTDPRGNPRCWAYLQRCQKFSRSAVHNLRTTDLGALPDNLLRDTERDALVSRRDTLVRHIEQLIATHGEPRILVFP